MIDEANEQRFPSSFLWGAATSAFQVEGSPLADGAGESNWYRFSKVPGNIADGSTGDVACDHYRRYQEDVDLMARLGLTAYRFSISWSRILPEGRGRVNQAGIDFYGRLIDQLLERGIRPCVTLHHWDLPGSLDDLGGWLHPDIPRWFADYARILFRAFGDRVPMWCTINEPWVIVDAGYLHGVHPPGHRNPAEVPRASHHLLLAHGMAVKAYRAEARREIGLVVNIEPKYPASTAPDDVAATARADAYMNRQYLDPVFLGRYPVELRDVFGSSWPEFPAGDFDIIAEPVDFLGLNYYTRAVVKHDPGALPLRASSVREPDRPRTDVDWEIHPESLTRALVWMTERYGRRPIYITENGAAFPEPGVAPLGPLDDPLRVDYLRSHLLAARAAVAQGVDLRGYFVWSLLDNCEWAHGYSKRFGIVHVDFETQRRTLKSSAEFYREVIRSGGASL